MSGRYEVIIDFRNPWEVIKHWITDPSLAPQSTWYSVKKYLCDGDSSRRLFDEPCTGQTWEKIDVGFSALRFHFSHLNAFYDRTSSPTIRTTHHAIFPSTFGLTKVRSRLKSRCTQSLYEVCGFTRQRATHLEMAAVRYSVTLEWFVQCFCWKNPSSSVLSPM